MTAYRFHFPDVACSLTVRLGRLVDALTLSCPVLSCRAMPILSGPGWHLTEGQIIIIIYVFDSVTTRDICRARL